jgi:hypothetical protein
MKKLFTLITLLFISSLAFSQITITSSVTNVTCFGLSNGSATISATGGTGAYTYTWLPSGTASPNILTNVAAGNYTVIVEDAVANTNSLVVTIGEPSMLAATTTVTNIACFGTATGIVNIIATGGIPPYQHSIAGGSYQSSSMFTNQPPGVQIISVKDGNNCTTTQTVVVTQAPQINIATTQTNVSCNGACNGVLNISATGGNPPYFYFTGFGTTTPLNSNVCAGTYSVFVQDANNCQSSIPITITQPVPLTASLTITNPNCSQADGAICANVNGGSLPYTYVWNNLSSNVCLSNIPTGLYSYTVTDSNGCIKTATSQVYATGGGTVSISNQSNVTCFGGINGSATAGITGATAPFSYQWIPTGQTTTTAHNLAAGTHTVSVIDFNGCISSTTVFISQPPPLSISSSVSNATCTCNGTASVSVLNGIPPYNYFWNFNYGVNYNTQSVSNLCAGFATVTAIDSYSCVVSTMINVGNSNTNTMTNTTVSSNAINETCYLSLDGGLDLIISGSNPGPFTYQWNNGAITQDLVNIASGVYSVTVMDANMDCYHLIDTIFANGINCGSISGNIYIDNNSDCIKNSGDNNFAGATIIANPGNRYGYTNANGDYIINNLPYGTYTLTSNTTANMIATCSTTLNNTINSVTPNSINNNFAKEYIPITQPDLQVSAYSNGIVPGFVCYVNYYISNLNNIPATGLFKAVLPSAFIPNITTGNPNTYSISGDTVIWNFNNITNLTGYNYFTINFTVPLSTPLGSIFTSCMWAQPNIADLNYANNTYCYQRLVTGSFDPNDKTVSPVGIGTTGDIAASVTDLTYLIRFQNTGNGPAVNIVVKDTLSSNVDVNTFEMLGSSHNYNIDILPGNILRWKFNNIMLPDSNSNEPASHGYIQYRIKRNSNNTPGTQIKNTAYIYFDFNEPVVTNTAINTIETITGIKSNFNSNEEWNVYPNPSTGVLYIVNSSSVKEATQIQVINSIGQTVLEENITSNYKNIDLSKLNNGVYFVKITSDKQSVIKRVVLSK